MTSKSVTLVVRRGALRRFDRLKEAARELPAEVIWDRRGVRPASDGVPPATDRRKGSPATWELADFAVAATASAASPRTRRATKLKS